MIEIDPFLDSHNPITFSAGVTAAQGLAAIRFTSSQIFYVTVPADTSTEIAIVLIDAEGSKAYVNPFYLNRDNENRAPIPMALGPS